MIKESSGKIYFFSLEFDLGFTLCKLYDYTDIAPFDGLLVNVLNIQLKDNGAIPSIEDIDKLKVLFGPVPLNKYPNIKGRGSWEYVGKSETLPKKIPVFKDTNHIIALNKATDWAKVDGWRRRYDFNNSGDYCEYEAVRELEMLVLYDMRNIAIRTTMHFLLLNNKKISDYYNLSDDNYRSIYLQIINTSFDKKKGVIFSKILK